MSNHPYLLQVVRGCGVHDQHISTCCPSQCPRPPKLWRENAPAGLAQAHLYQVGGHGEQITETIAPDLPVIQPSAIWRQYDSGYFAIHSSNDATFIRSGSVAAPYAVVIAIVQHVCEQFPVSGDGDVGRIATNGKPN